MKIIWLNLFRDRDAIVNSPSMPVKPVSAGVYDTSANYKEERVSYGREYNGDSSLKDGTSTKFSANKLTGHASLQEENLVHCKYLNLKKSSIERLNIKLLPQLRILVLQKTGIQVL